ncbi:MAG: hypothetical protein ABL903_07590 [Methylococcales bacterium]
MRTSQPMDAMKHPLFCYAVNALMRCVFMVLLLNSVVSANERQSDPDGCLVCHALEGLQFIDKKGVLRIATIDKADYLGSLHGSVPCTDCHQIKTYPHEVKDGLVDCASECHVNEPSKGEKFSHKPVVKEFLKSTHGNGRVKDFEGGNRLEEDSEPDPSCRRCHSNTPYIIPAQMDKFKSEMNHADAECGKCHVGEVWMKQFGGHVLRRLVGSRWNKNDINKSCTQCHADYERMAKVKIEDPNKRQPNNTLPVEGQGITDGKSPKDKRTMPVTYRWIHSTESYERTLHSRILVVGEEKGASCLDCHIQRGAGFNGHGILKDEDKTASTHPEQLGETCGASGCHNYAKSFLTQGFVKTDVHDINQVKLPDFKAVLDPKKLTDVWHWSSIVLIVFSAGFGLSSLYWLIVVYPKSKKTASNIIGDERFEEVMLGRKPKNSPPKASVKPVPAAAVPPKAELDKASVPVGSTAVDAKVPLVEDKTASPITGNVDPKAVVAKDELARKEVGSEPKALAETGAMTTTQTSRPTEPVVKTPEPDKPLETKVSTADAAPTKVEKGAIDTVNPTDISEGVKPSKEGESD